MKRYKFLGAGLTATMILPLRRTLERFVRYSALCSILLFFVAVKSFAQTQPLSLSDCISIALKNNLYVKTASLEIEQSRALQKSAFDPAKTNLTLTQDPTSGGNIDNAIGVIQSFALPGLYKKQKTVLKQQTMLTEKSKSITEAEIIRSVKEVYYNYLYGLEKIKVLDHLDSLYNDFAKKAEVRQRTGETSNLEKLTAQNKYQEVQLLKREAASDLKVYQLSLQQLLNRNDVVIKEDSLSIISFVDVNDTTVVQGNPLLGYYKQSINLSNSRIKLEKAKLLPELTLGYSHQFLIKGFDPADNKREYFNGTRIAGFQIGIGVPLFSGSYRARINAEKIGARVAQTQLSATQQKLQTQWQQAYQEYLKYKQTTDYYTTSGLQLANEQIRVAEFSFSKGEIGYVEFIQNISLAVQGKLNYLSAINALNTAVINLQYLQGNQQ